MLPQIHENTNSTIPDTGIAYIKDNHSLLWSFKISDNNTNMNTATSQTNATDNRLTQMILRLVGGFLSFFRTNAVEVPSSLISTSTETPKILASCFNVTMSGIDSPRSHLDKVLSE